MKKVNKKHVSKVEKYDYKNLFYAIFVFVVAFVIVLGAYLFVSVRIVDILL